jgi:hypothetical protein
LLSKLIATPFFYAAAAAAAALVLLQLHQCVVSVLWKQPDTCAAVIHRHCTNHWSRYTACWEARAVLHSVREKTERAFVKVEQYTYTGTLLDAACFIVGGIAVAVEIAIIAKDEPAVSAIRNSIVAIWFKVRLGNAEKAMPSFIP